MNGSFSNWNFGYFRFERKLYDDLREIFIFLREALLWQIFRLKIVFCNLLIGIESNRAKTKSITHQSNHKIWLTLSQTLSIYPSIWVYKPKRRMIQVDYNNVNKVNRKTKGPSEFYLKLKIRITFLDVVFLLFLYP